MRQVGLVRIGCVLVLCACGTSTADGSSGPGPATDDAGDDAATADAGADVIAYPAPHPAAPEVLSGGTVLVAPKIVNVTFAGDPLEADIDTFADAMAKTTYWGDRTKEYGVAPLAPIARIHSTFAPPASITDADIATWLQGQLDGTHPDWPAPDANTIYALYYPPNVSVSMMGSASCSTFHGYHSNTSLKNLPVPYAVITRCDSLPELPTAKGIQYVAAVASHEIIEGITDPFPMTNNLGFAATDDDHLAFDLLGLAELGDMCALIGDAFYTPPDFPYPMQRIWSNAAAAAGREPCLPAPAGQVHVDAAPVLGDNVSFTYEGQSAATKGVKIPVAETKTIEIDLFSEAPASGPWAVAAKEVAGNGNLDLTLDRATGKNGDKLALKIHVKSANPTYGAEIFVIQSTLGTQKNLWVGMVGN